MANKASLTKPLHVKEFEQKARSERASTRKIIKGLRQCKPKKLDAAFREAHQEAFEAIDCLDCANCCRTTGPRFTPEDIDRLARRFKRGTSEFIQNYLRIDEQNDYVLQQLPCPFLGADNYCSIYEDRPEACRDFPHTHRHKMHRQLPVTAQNAEICPAVFRMIQRMESLVKRSK